MQDFMTEERDTERHLQKEDRYLLMTYKHDEDGNIGTTVVRHQITNEEFLYSAAAIVKQLYEDTELPKAQVLLYIYKIAEGKL